MYQEKTVPNSLLNLRVFVVILSTLFLFIGPGLRQVHVTADDRRNAHGNGQPRWNQPAQQRPNRGPRKDTPSVPYAQIPRRGAPAIPAHGRPGGKRAVMTLMAGKKS